MDLFISSGVLNRNIRDLLYDFVSTTNLMNKKVRCEIIYNAVCMQLCSARKHKSPIVSHYEIFLF